jgi:hypothetical protein
MNLLALQQDFRLWLEHEDDEAASRLGGGDGLQVYLNNYRASLMACLTENHGKLALWLGEEAFQQAMIAHIQTSLPSSWTLDDYGADVPQTLARLYPDDPEIADLARLERALTDAFVGPDHTPPDPNLWAGVDWDAAVLTFAPTVKLIEMRSNATDIWSALNAGTPPPAATHFPNATACLVWRQEFISCFRPLDPVEQDAITCAMNGMSFADLCQRLSDRLGPEAGAAAAGELLARWIRDQIVIGAGQVESRSAV